MLHRGVEQREREPGEARTPILIAGLPGKMATLIAETVSRNQHYDLLLIGITSQRHRGEVVKFGTQQVCA